MSKKLQKRATKLTRKAEARALVIRRVVREYREAIQTSGKNTSTERDRHVEIENAVARYNQVHRALKRLRKKIQPKAKNNIHVVPRLLKQPRAN